MKDIERQVLRIIGEDPSAPDVFTDTTTGLAQIRDSITDAVQEITMLAGGYTETVFLPLVVGAGLYRLRFTRGHFGWVTGAWAQNRKLRLTQTDWVALNHWDPRWLVHSGRPDWYFQAGLDLVGLVPKPASADDVIRLDVTVIPRAHGTDRERIKIRDAWRWAVVNYAVSEFWASRGDARSADLHHVDYLGALGNRLRYTPTVDRTVEQTTDKQLPEPNEASI